MNFKYFACASCKEYTSAGYRWAYWTLEHKGIVLEGQPVNVEVVMNTTEYWSPPSEPNSEWLLKGVLPAAKTFISKHSRHGITYEDSGAFFGREDFDSWNVVHE
jgi:hypothetical protein